MTEAATRIDEGKQRLQAAAEPAPVTRTKDPSYHVFERTGEENVYRMLTTTTGEHAPNRKEAIKQVAKTRPADDHEPRTYLVIPAKEFQLLTRRIERRVEDVFE